MLFAKATACDEAIGASTAITTASLKVGLTATVIGTVGTKLGVTVAAGITAAALAIGGVTIAKDYQLSKQPQMPVEKSFYTVQASNSGLAKGPFRHPCLLLGSHCPQGSIWKGRSVNGRWPVGVAPQELLVGPARSGVSLVSLPEGYWVELKFCSQIIDGPGDDIVLVEVGGYRKQADVFITNGAGQEYLLGAGTVVAAGHADCIEIGFDISGISLPFVPYAIRIVGTDTGRSISSSFDLANVRARAYISYD